MSIWFIADTHFNHANIIKYCNRPFNSVAEMNNILIDGWNGVVGPKDVVYHLGDFGFGNVLPILEALNGVKVLIQGSHDKPCLKPKVMSKFKRVVPLDVVRVNGVKIALCHYSMRVWPYSHYGSWHLYGHSHGGLAGHGLSFDVGVDATKLWRPLSFEEVELRMRDLRTQLLGKKETENNG